MSELTKEFLYKEYVENNKSTSQIAAEYGINHPNTVRRALQRYGIPLRNRSEAQKNALAIGNIEHPTKGKRRDKATVLKISEGNIEAHKEKSIEQKMETVKKAKERWANLTEYERAEQIKVRTEGIHRAAKEGSDIEKKCVECLQNAGFYIEKHRKGLIINDKLEVDIFIPELATVIEVDGPAHFLPIYGPENLEKHIAADNRKAGLLFNSGFRLIRVRLLKKTISKMDEENVKNGLLSICNSIRERETKNNYFEVDVK